MKAPLASIRFPGMAASIALGAMLLALTAAAYPLFISATAGKLLASNIADPTLTRYMSGPSYSRTNVRFGAAGIRMPSLVDELGTVFGREAPRSPLLGPAIEYIFGPAASVSTPADPRPSSGPMTGRLVAATDVLDHVRVVAGTDGPGVWIPQQIADAVDIGPSDDLELRIGRRSVRVPVDGVYRNLYSQPPAGYWLRWFSWVYPNPACHDCPPPPQPILVDRGQLISLADRLGQAWGTVGWLAPLGSDVISWDQAHELERFVEGLSSRMRDPGSYLGRLFDCCGVRLSAPCCRFQSRTLFVSAISGVDAVVEKRISMLVGTGRLLQGAGILVSMLVLIAAGAFALAGRRVEAGLLVARGAGPGEIAARSAVEALIPCAVGGLIGLGTAALLVGALGPDGRISASAWSTALAGAAIAVLASLFLLGAVSAASNVRASELHRARLSWLRLVPWDVAVATIALVGLVRLRSRATATAALSSGRSLALLALTTLLLVGLASISARLFRRILSAVRDRTTRFPPAPYLAVRRLESSPRLTLLLVGASVLCWGIFVESQTMVGSLRATVEAKARIYVGSDVQGRVDYRTPLPPSFPLPLTRVTRLVDAGELAGGERFDLLAIDPSTFASAAYWEDAFASSTLEEIVRRLAEPGAGSVPVVAVGAEASDATSVEIQQHRVPISVVERASAFPGMTFRRTLLVVDGKALLRSFEDGPDPLGAANGSTEFWVRGDQTQASALLERLRYQPYLILTADEVKDIPTFVAVIDTFLVLGALGIVAALLVFAGMLMYLQARQRSQVVSYGLSLRMGMSREAHRRALILELVAMLGASFVVGVAFAVANVLLVSPLLDPLSTIPPTPLFRLPAWPVGLAFVGLCVAASIGGWFTDRLARRFDLGEVMRLAE